MQLDAIDKKLLNLVQVEFPVTARPYKEIAEKLNVTEQEVIDRMKHLLEEDIIRRFGGVFNSRRLGYKGTLCAMKVPEKRIEEVTDIVNSYVAITHNYLRDHEYNIWFTILTNSQEKTQKIIDEIIERTGITDVLNLPAEKFFKVWVSFKVDEE